MGWSLYNHTGLNAVLRERISKLLTFMAIEVTCTAEDGQPLILWAAYHLTLLTTHDGRGWESSKPLIIRTSDRRKSNVLTGVLNRILNSNATHGASTILLLPLSVHRSRKRSQGRASDTASLKNDEP